MKTSFIMILAFLGCSINTLSQGVGINENGASSDPSALLDVNSTNKGFLPPRMSSLQRNAISNPATGLIVYDIVLSCLMINNGTPSIPKWQCIGGDLTVNCDSSRFALSSPAIDPLCTGLFIGTSGYQVKFVLVNNSFSNISNLNMSSALSLSGNGSAGLSVQIGQNTNVNINSGSSTTITYNLNGSPTTAGNISATLNYSSLSCTLENITNDPNSSTGNGLNGTSSTLFNYSCLAIKNAVPTSPDGQYWIDPDGTCPTLSPMLAYCDMTTDGGGWTLVANYTRTGSNGVRTSRSNFPLINGNLGQNENGNSTSWGEVGPNILNPLQFTQVRYLSTGGASGNTLHYRTSNAANVNLVKTQSPSGISILNITILPGHNNLAYPTGYNATRGGAMLQGLMNQFLSGCSGVEQVNANGGNFGTSLYINTYYHSNCGGTAYVYGASSVARTWVR